MTAERLAERVLDDESLTSGLDGPSAELVVAFLVARAERLVGTPDPLAKLNDLCRHVRKLIPDDSDPETVQKLLAGVPA